MIASKVGGGGGGAGGVGCGGDGNPKMPVKKWFRQLRPVQLHIVLVLTIVFFVIELVVSHVTHALTLLMDSYYTLCNILALSACMISIKYGESANSQQNQPPQAGEENVEVEGLKTSQQASGKRQENKLKNTFGWTRIDVISMLICFVFLGSLSFSILVEALQTLIHINHQDAMHHPVYVFAVGAAGLVLNAICYFLIGGYTFHQGSFLFVTDTGCVVLSGVVVNNESVRRGERRISRTKSVNLPPPQNPRRRRRDLREILRDVVGCLFVMACSVSIYFTDNKDIAKFIDPLVSIVSASALMILSYPYMKESCMILLQTIPDTINIDSLKEQLLQHFPDIISVHDLHIWELTANKVISTAHIIFQNPTIYLKITDRLTEFFHEHGITQVTIQPEFYSKSNHSASSNNSSSECLMNCAREECKTSHCCPELQPKVLEFSHKWKSMDSELAVVEAANTIEIKQIKALQEEDLPVSEQTSDKSADVSLTSEEMPSQETTVADEISANSI